MPPMPNFTDPKLLPERWSNYLRELDSRMSVPAELHCMGGFVVTVLYRVARDTGDLDVLTVVPREQHNVLLELGGRGSQISKNHRLYLEIVGVADYPEDYEDRLASLWPGFFDKLSLRALEIHDVALAKLTRNNNKDQFDVKQLAQQGYLDPEVLRERYFKELRPYIMAGPLDRHDLTLQLWLEYFTEND